VTDPAKASEYTALALPLVETHGDKRLVMGETTVLREGKEHKRGAIFEFPDRASALAWYGSPAYQALLDLRGQAMDCSVTLIG
jgi:uncharacterized protein (DUF1330 family)